jgi:hypothetical protein
VSTDCCFCYVLSYNCGDFLASAGGNVNAY